MVPEGAESDFGLQGWIGTLGLKQIFLIYSVRGAPEPVTRPHQLKMFLKVLEYQFQLKSYKQISFEEVRDPLIPLLNINC